MGKDDDNTPGCSRTVLIHCNEEYDIVAYQCRDIFSLRMANNALSNGRIQQTVGQHVRNNRGKKVPEIPAIESNNWLLHRHYVRQEFGICKILIDQELTRSNGHSEYASYLQGLILRKEGKIQDSLDCFQTSYNVNSTNVNNVKQIAKSLLIMGSHKRAVEAYLEAEKISVIPDWEIYHNLGESYIRLNQFQDAKKHLKRSIELTKNQLPYLALARLHVHEDQIAEARNAYVAALSGNPESIDASTELGLLYLKIGDVQRAFQQFGAALAHSPNYTRAVLPMAYVIQNHREYDVALSKYKLAAQSISESSALWNNVGMCFYGKQKFVAAISCLKRSHYLNPLAFLPACNLGMVFLTTGQPASAAIYLCAAVSADPKNPTPYLLLGLALKRLDDLEGSEKALEKAHGFAPQDPLVLINYAIILDARGKSLAAAELLTALNDVTAVLDVDLQAISCLKRSHYLNPLAFLPACNLGMVFLTTGQPASVAIYLCAAVSADPKNPTPYLLLGLALKRLDDLEGSEKALEKAHGFAPQNPLVLINYAIILDACGKSLAAAELLTALNDVTAVLDVDLQVHLRLLEVCTWKNC